MQVTLVSQILYMETLPSWVRWKVLMTTDSGGQRAIFCHRFTSMCERVGWLPRDEGDAFE